jgi:hypothetical protein
VRSIEFFTRRLRHGLQPLELLARVRLDVRRHPGLRDRLVQACGLLVLAAVFAELLLDGLELFAQQVLALPVVQLLLGALTDLRERRSTSRRCDSRPSNLRRRSVVDPVSSSACFSTTSASSTLAVMSASSTVPRVVCSACTSSAGTLGSSDSNSNARSRSCSASACAPADSSAAYSTTATFAARKG